MSDTENLPQFLFSLSECIYQQSGEYTAVSFHILILMPICREFLYLWCAIVLFCYRLLYNWLCSHIRVKCQPLYPRDNYFECLKTAAWKNTDSLLHVLSVQLWDIIWFQVQWTNVGASSHCFSIGQITD